MFTVAILACLLLSACGLEGAEEQKPKARYKVTLYSGGVAVREWDGVSAYKRWSDQFIEIRVDGEPICIGGGPLTIESCE